MTFFCPVCWREIQGSSRRCPQCGAQIHTISTTWNYTDKLINSLSHPEPVTRCRAASILGMRQESCAVEALISMIQESADVFVTLAGVRALRRIGTPLATAFLADLCATHPAKLVRDEAQNQDAPQ